MGVEIIEVKTKQELKKFIQFPQELYKGNPYYVSELYLSVKWMLSTKNPFLIHSQIALFLATINDEIVGRIVAIYNKRHLEVYNDNTGFFGFFDAINNIEVARALFQISSDWLKNKGITQMVGPTNLTTNDSCGFLLNGFEHNPMVLMPYNYKYYIELCEHCGFEKTMDLFAYEVNGKAVIEKYENILKRSIQKMEDNGTKIRPVSTKYFKDDIARLRNVYNKCNENNWGFIPLNENEFSAMAKDLKMIAPLDCALLVEKGEEIIGFVIAVPDINQALKHVVGGKLFPFGFLKLLWYKRKVNKARIMILGVLKDYSGQGIDLVLYHKITEALNKHKIYGAEASFVLESNKIMNAVLNKIEGRRIKEYRIYGRKISSDNINLKKENDIQK
jgi:GNAT superfamily N-acetyltransferase